MPSPTDRPPHKATDSPRQNACSTFADFLLTIENIPLRFLPCRCGMAPRAPQELACQTLPERQTYVSLLQHHRDDFAAVPHLHAPQYLFPWSPARDMVSHSYQNKPQKQRSEMRGRQIG